MKASTRSEMSDGQRRERRQILLTLQLNRCAALNKDEEWKLSLRAANAALKLDANNLKGLYRRAVALAGLRQYAEHLDLARRLLVDAISLGVPVTGELDQLVAYDAKSGTLEELGDAGTVGASGLAVADGRVWLAVSWSMFKALISICAAGFCGPVLTAPC